MDCACRAAVAARGAAAAQCHHAARVAAIAAGTADTLRHHAVAANARRYNRAIIRNRRCAAITAQSRITAQANDSPTVAARAGRTAHALREHAV